MKEIIVKSMDSRYKRVEISGTGNGVDKKYLDPFLVAFQSYYKLIGDVLSYYLKNKDKTFSGQYGLLNNWHRTYKIEVPKDNFPFHVANAFSITCWGYAQVSIVFPLKFNAPTFGGGEEDNMQVAFVTEVYIRDPKEFFKDENLPLSLRKAIILEYLKFCRSNRDQQYKDKIVGLERLVKQNNLAKESAKELIASVDLEIPELEKQITLVKKLAQKFL